MAKTDKKTQTPKKKILSVFSGNISKDEIFNCSIVSTIENLQRLVDKYGKSAILSVYDWDDDTEIYVCYDREETDEELAIRLEREKQRQEQIAREAEADALAKTRAVEADLKELARLKKLYEKC